MSESDKQIHILLVDDHAIIRRGLAELLADFEDIVIVAQASDGIYAVSQC